MNRDDVMDQTDTVDHGDVMYQTETDVLGAVTQTEGHYDVMDQTETDILGSVTQTGKQSDITTCGSDGDRQGDMAMLVS